MQWRRKYSYCKQAAWPAKRSLSESNYIRRHGNPSHGPTLLINLSGNILKENHSYCTPFNHLNSLLKFTLAQLIKQMRLSPDCYYSVLIICFCHYTHDCYYHETNYTTASLPFSAGQALPQRWGGRFLSVRLPLETEGHSSPQVHSPRCPSEMVAWQPATGLALQRLRSRHICLVHHYHN